MKDAFNPSEASTSLGYVMRLNDLLSNAAENSMNLEIEAWYHSLKCIDREIDCEMNPTEKKNLKEKFDSALSLMNEKNRKTGINTKLYDLLDSTEKELRRIIKKADLLRPPKRSFKDKLKEDE